MFEKKIVFFKDHKISYRSMISLQYFTFFLGEVVQYFT